MRRILLVLPILFLVLLPIHADEALHGSWQGGFVDEEGNDATVLLTFEADGGFAMAQETTLGEEFQEVVAATEVPVEKVTVDATGTYEVEGDKIRVDITELVVNIGERPFLEVLTEVAKVLAALAASFADISAEDYPAFEANFVNEFVGDMEQDFLSGFIEEVTWSVDGETLTITAPTEDGGEETTQYQRVATAVAGTSWGALKANLLR